MGSKILVMLVSLPCQEIESAWLARGFGTFLFVSFLIQQLILQGAMCNQEWPAGLVMARYPFFVVRSAISHGRATFEPILRVFSWSMNAPCQN